jgi:hypothetical protein
MSKPLTRKRIRRPPTLADLCSFRPFKGFEFFISKGSAFSNHTDPRIFRPTLTVQFGNGLPWNSLASLMFLQRFIHDFVELWVEHSLQCNHAVLHLFIAGLQPTKRFGYIGIVEVSTLFGVGTHAVSHVLQWRQFGMHRLNELRIEDIGFNDALSNV